MKNSKVEEKKEENGSTFDDDYIIENLRKLVEEEMLHNGWTLKNEQLCPPSMNGKDELRRFHRNHRIERAQKERKIVERFGSDLINEFAEGNEVDPKNFSPELIQVGPDSWESLIFRFASLLWSIPISRGYGRRMRFLVRDTYNNKLVGLIALGDPVFNLKARDQVIGWDQSDRKERLYNVMDAFGLGAVPPYNRLLAGKFVALAAVSNNIRNEFSNKYKDRKTIIQDKKKDPSLVLVTTTSALGRSSIYNRLRLPNEENPVYRRVGFSSGYGHFHVSDKVFSLLRDWLRDLGDPYADGHLYGDGPSWRLRTLRKAFDRLGFEGDLLKHGVKREVFLVPLAKNYQEFLRGENKKPKYYNRSMHELVDFFKERWMIPRSLRINDWHEWTRADTWKAIIDNCDWDDLYINLTLF